MNTNERLPSDLLDRKHMILQHLMDKEDQEAANAFYDQLDESTVETLEDVDKEYARFLPLFYMDMGTGKSRFRN